jgi:hypothetical protein
VVGRAVDRNAREDDKSAKMDQLGCRCCLKGNVVSINIPTPNKRDVATRNTGNRKRRGGIVQAPRAF